MTAINADPDSPLPDVDVSFVVIGYNEAATLEDCLASVKRVDLEGFTWELIYVDGGSSDNSIEIARQVGVDRLLGGDTRRRAAENRNLGLSAAKGRFVQFVDGDMTLAPDWPRAAVAFLDGHDGFAAVCGNLDEASTGLLFEALQIDWGPREEVIRHCGGAAMFVRDVLDAAGGFPTDVAYGEEPLLCWRLRNNHNKRIYQLCRIMARHNLDFRGLRDYWQRNVRCGKTYAEIAARCWHTRDPLWRRECLVHVAWALAILAAAALLVFGDIWVRLGVAVAGFLVFGRKCLQTWRRGYSLRVSLVYALHTYFSKLSIAWGECRWVLQSLFGRRV